MEQEQKIQSIISCYKKLAEQDPSKASAWLDEKMNAMIEEEREALEQAMSLQNILV